MDSKPSNASVPSTKDTPTGSLLIRAPLTVDSDSEYDSIGLETESTIGGDSGLNSFDENNSELGFPEEGEGFLSGNEEFDTVFERVRTLGETQRGEFHWELLTSPVLDPQAWDHDIEYDGVSLESSLAIAGYFPGAFAVQITKDKREFNVHLDSSVCAKHGENRSTMAGFEIQTVRKQLAYISRGETKFKNFKTNQTTAGLSVTLLGENVATGLKIVDQIAGGKRLLLAGSAGTMRSQGNTAYGANIEIRLKDEDFPIEQNQTSFGFSEMEARSGCNGQLTVTIIYRTKFFNGSSCRIEQQAEWTNQYQNNQLVSVTHSTGFSCSDCSLHHWDGLSWL
ncbi:hypothetical protein F3Y22_tig00112159pilonHSYRG00344 [Hibiscus syriacus]|uniref:Translocase of chloroplast 159/132 membrane anchor domain-containing protein n=1 Tax=Hibiscus syriacus TaxID=106335 RepID=A0A6A2X5Q1_HIBSY|nr:hypothetical protein F3Y22_tig00112159pilonHSYRG00344 [Hibiscus syriacus]